ncbi:Hypothetical predicted protein, partial [Marmota monax]
ALKIESNGFMTNPKVHCLPATSVLSWGGGVLGVHAVGITTGSLTVNPEPKRNGTKDPDTRNQDEIGSVSVLGSTMMARR